MEVTVNGESKTVPDGIRVSELLALLGFTEGPVAVEMDREVVPRATHESTEIPAGAVLEVVHFVGGG